MKKHILILIIFGFLQTTSFGQLVLKSTTSNKTIKIPNGSILTVKLPTTTEAPDSCDCFSSFTGELMSASKEKVDLQIKSTNRVYRDIDGINKNVYTLFNYPSTKITSSISLKNPLSLTKGEGKDNTLNGFAALLMGISVVDALVINPFLPKAVQKNNNKFIWATFGVGLTLAIIPKTKTYHFQQPKNGEKKKLWLLATP